MKFAILPLTCLIVLSLFGSSDALVKFQPPPIPVPKDARAMPDKWITQKLDHFDTSNRNTFQMRYMANDEFYQVGGPIFIFVGGEWEIDGSFIQAGPTHDLAREMKGYLFYTEHRYYGKTRPTEDLTAENLRYLDTDQALEDLAHFIRYQKTFITDASGVILMGGSYAGMMVAWFMQRYPTLANGAWSSSAPIRPKVDFFEYKETVGLAVRTIAGQPCYDRIQRAFVQIENALATQQFAMLDNEFNTCTTLVGSNEFDRYIFLDTISGALVNQVQYHSGTEIDAACGEIMTTDITSDLSAFAAFVRQGMGGGCLAFSYSGMVEFFGATSWESDAAKVSWRQWMYQTCNEFGFYTTLNSTDQPFGLHDYAHVFTENCRDAYPGLFLLPQSVADNVARTNDYNFGLQPMFKNVLSTHGTLDPWAPAGLTETTINGAPVTILPLASHCSDLMFVPPTETAEMRELKVQIRELIGEWLA